MKTRILYPTNFSPPSVRVFEKAVRFARASRATLFVVHVLTPAALASTREVPAERGRDSVVDRSGHGRAKRRLDELVARAHRARARAIGLLLEGDPADQIVRAAKSTSADVIVMRARGRGHVALARFFRGSVTDRVNAQAPCPVLTFRDTRRARRRPSGEESLRTG